jgi:hypothetical protein
MRKNKWILIILLLVLGNMGTSLARAASPRQMGTVSDLWLDIRVLNRPLAEVFKHLARPNDIARVEHVEDLVLLRDIDVGRKLVVFKSVAEAEHFMPLIADQVDIVGYNLEHGPANPTNEQARPVESAKRMRALADQYGLLLAFGPDHDFALSQGVEIAPYVDIFVLQVQLVQWQPNTVQDFVLPLIPQLRQANPNLQISVQVRTEGNTKDDLLAIVELVDSLRDRDNNLSLNGVSVLTSRETVANAEVLIKELQTTTRPISRPKAGQPSALGPAVGKPGAPSAAQNTALEGDSAAGPNINIPWPVVMVASLLVGAAIGGATVALICTLQKQDTRKRR